MSWQDDKAGSYDIYSSAGYVPELDVEIPEFSAMLVPMLVLMIVAIVARSKTAQKGHVPRE